MKYIGAIDQGTTSTRFMIFTSEGTVVSSAQKEHKQICPRPGWVEHDAEEIWLNASEVIRTALSKAGLAGEDLAAVGITNQRETIIPFDKATGRPLYHGIVWQDLRGSGYIDELKKSFPEEKLKRKTGLLYSPYFSASKIRWLLDNVPKVRKAAENGDIVFGTIDSYLVSRLTGSAPVTDATNASRYMLMDIHSLEWDDEMLSLTGISRSMLPAIVPSIGRIYGYTDPEGPFGAAIPVSGILLPENRFHSKPVFSYPAKGHILPADILLRSEAPEPFPLHGTGTDGCV